MSQDDFKRHVAVVVILLAVLAILLLTPYGAWADESRRERDLVRWTRHYEQRMGIAQNLRIRFANYLGVKDNNDEICGLMEARGIAYSESAACKKAYVNVRILALHEACHWRMQHHMTDLPDAQKESEVAACMTWYSEQ